MSATTKEWTAESWLFPPLPAVLFESTEYDSIVTDRAMLESTLDRLIPSLIARYGLHDDELSVLCMKRMIRAEASNEPGERHGRVTLSNSRRAMIQELYANKCAVCRRVEPPMHIDHIVPLKRGGSNAAYNLQLLCFQCNGDKGGLGMSEWLDARATSLSAAA